jgi:patatin-like phospholipase/acyl hydrolase
MDMIIGTSIGNIISLSLAYGLTPEKIQHILKNHGKTIFSCKNINPFKPLFSNRNFMDLINDTFPEDLQLVDLHKIVATTTVQVSGSIDSIKPFIYSNAPLSPNKHALVRDVALSGGTVPAFFPICNNQIDGAVVAGNPSLVGICVASSQLNIPLNNISMLSLGTGFNPTILPDDANNWGPTQWIINRQMGLPLLDVFSLGQSALESRLSSMLLKSRYHRLDIPLDKDVSFNDYKSINYLIDKANKYDLSDTFRWINRIWCS